MPFVRSVLSASFDTGINCTFDLLSFCSLLFFPTHPPSTCSTCLRCPGRLFQFLSRRVSFVCRSPFLSLSLSFAFSFATSQFVRPFFFFFLQFHFHNPFISFNCE